MNIYAQLIFLLLFVSTLGLTTLQHSQLASQQIIQQIHQYKQMIQTNATAVTIGNMSQIHVYQPFHAH